MKILDFGLARSVRGDDAVTGSRDILGSPGFMSPEQAEGEAVGERTDLFSLGCVLYQLATGAAPFSGADVYAVLEATRTQTPRPARERNAAVPGWLSDLIGRLLARQAGDRPASAWQVAEELAAGRKEESPVSSKWRRRFSGTNPPMELHEESVQSPEESPANRAMVWVGVAGGVACVMLVVGLAMWLWTPPREKDPGRDAPVVPDLPPLTATLDIRVWKKADPTRGKLLGNAGVLPLRAGDYLRAEMTTSRPAYFYVVYLDAEGKASPLYPWRKDDWADVPAEERRQAYTEPPDPTKDGSPLTAGPSGVEAYLLVARETPLTAAERGRLAAALGGKPQKGKFDPLRGAVWLGGGEDRYSVDKDRARPGEAGEVADPVERVRRLVRTELKELGVAVRGVCYPFAGE